MEIRGTIAVLLLTGAAALGSAQAEAPSPPPTETPSPPPQAAPPLPPVGTGAALPKKSSVPPPAPMVGSARLVAVMPNKTGAPTLVGKSGELYVPAANLKWQRAGAGGVSTDVVSIFKGVGSDLFAVGSRAPLFQWQAGVWSAFHLANNGRSAVSPGALPTISIGRHIYELIGGSWIRIASAQGAIRALHAARANEIYLVTTTGKLFVGRKNWKPLPITLPAGDQIRAIVGLPGKHEVALTEQNRLYLLTRKGARLMALGPEYRGLEVHTLAVAAGKLLLAGRVGVGAGQKNILAEVESQKLVTTDSLWPLQAGDQFALLHEDHKQGLIVATRQGQVRIKNKDGSWSNGRLDIAPPSPPENFSGSGPARSK